MRLLSEKVEEHLGLVTALVKAEALDFSVPTVEDLSSKEPPTWYKRHNRRTATVYMDEGPYDEDSIRVEIKDATGSGAQEITDYFTRKRTIIDEVEDGKVVKADSVPVDLTVTSKLCREYIRELAGKDMLSVFIAPAPSAEKGTVKRAWESWAGNLGSLDLSRIVDGIFHFRIGTGTEEND